MPSDRGLGSCIGLLEEAIQERIDYRAPPCVPANQSEETVPVVLRRTPYLIRTWNGLILMAFRSWPYIRQGCNELKSRQVTPCGSGARAEVEEATMLDPLRAALLQKFSTGHCRGNNSVNSALRYVSLQSHTRKKLVVLQHPLVLLLI